MSDDQKNQTLDIEFTTSPGFSDFLIQNHISLVLSTYQTGHLFFLGPKTDGGLYIAHINLQRSMGLWVHGASLYASSLFQLWRFENVLAPGQWHEGHDRLFVPQVGWTTGDLDVHDIVVEKSGRLVFVNTRFSCLATTSEVYNFIPLWRPKVISALGPEDRCHLNGVAMHDGKVAYATAFGLTDQPHSWREGKASGGVVWDLVQNEVIARGLAMPHSPRWYQNKLWLLESGSGQFGWVNLNQQSFEAICFCPGYLRGLNFHDQYAIVGSSLPRHESGFSGLPLDDQLTSRGLSPMCGVFIIDLVTGEVKHTLTITGAVQELYDIAVLEGVRRPRAVGFNNDEIHYYLNIAPQATIA